MLFIYFDSKISCWLLQLVKSGCFEFLFLFSFSIFVSKTKLLFFQPVKIFQISHVIFESTISFHSNFASIFSTIKRNSSVLFLAETLYILVKKSPLRRKFLKLLSAWIKICQIHHVNFEMRSQFFSTFFTIFHFHDA